jgi:hypothetical protein
MGKRASVGIIVALLAVGSAGTEGCRKEKSHSHSGPAERPPAARPSTATPASATEIFEDDLVLLAEGDPDYGPAPLTVLFTVESLVVKEITGAKYTWDFGDGSPASHEAGPTHTYEKPGSYVATIRVVDGAGENGWDEVDVEVTEPIE